MPVSLTNRAVLPIRPAASSLRLPTSAVADWRRQYWFLRHRSGHGDNLNVGEAEPNPWKTLQGYPIELGVAPSGPEYLCGFKARTNAALLANLTMSGWTTERWIPFGGFVPQ